MRLIRNGFIALCLLLGAANAAMARVNVDINFSLFPELVPVPGYPVYYAPYEEANYFFYDGMYWVYEDDDWYVSDWYNGPWEYVDREYVPVFILRIPVRYYRRPPVYFRGWVYDEPPRWGQRWGYGWERNHHNWNHWDRRHSPALAPLPDYQRHYSRDRYPDRDEQRAIRDSSNYRYQPRDVKVQPRYRDSNERAPEQRDQRNRQDERNQNGERNRNDDFRERSNSRSDDWQRSSQRRDDAEQRQRQQQEQNEQREHNVQRRMPVMDSPRGQQSSERNSSPDRDEGRDRSRNSHSDRQQQEQRQPAAQPVESPRQQPRAPQQRDQGQDQGRNQHGDRESRQDDDRGGKH